MANKKRRGRMSRKWPQTLPVLISEPHLTGETHGRAIEAIQEEDQMNPNPADRAEVTARHLLNQRAVSASEHDLLVALLLLYAQEKKRPAILEEIDALKKELRRRNPILIATLAVAENNARHDRSPGVALADVNGMLQGASLGFGVGRPIGGFIGALCGGVGSSAAALKGIAGFKVAPTFPPTRARGRRTDEVATANA